MRALPLPAWRNAGLVCAVMIIALASCDGIQQRVEMLRAEHVEIIDDKGTTKMDVEKQLRTLEERIAKLEAAQAAHAVAPPATAPPDSSAPAASATPDAGAPAADAGDAQSPTPPPLRGPGRQNPAQPKRTTPPDLF